ncbi:MAG: aldehyde ferredoxin oxidoreductase [Candidatus Lokiarchaeota archaeon]|nr:aldehyde ferredoxin oxidoreductase [Candidatus Lokiarchaeota archaeon]MBD3340378.1 aldehyde ferredoxin oxidoreductase [Candidatus Lokiarchaeota archaeon]
MEKTTMPNGYCGKVLWVDLSEGSFTEEELPEEIYKKYIGGYGLGTKLIYENMPANTDPLSPESVFGFFPALLCGTIAPLTGRYMLAGKSPLTGTWGDANCGGFFGPEIKKCGYDAILLKGKADKPTYISIIDGNKQLEDASEIWDLDCVETEEKLGEKHGSVRIASIGQAGVNLSLISGIVNDKGRIAGRSGFGAIMGSKNLKAIVLKGNTKISVADSDTLKQLTQDYNKNIREAAAGSIQLWRDVGTPWLNNTAIMLGDAPIKNWSGGKEDFPPEKHNNILGTEIVKYRKKEFGCFACPVQCGDILTVPEAGLEETHKPEYETCAVFCHMTLSDDLETLFKINELCNRAGIDTISTGSSVAFAIECFENDILTKDDTDGLELTWGNSEAILELVKKIINREGIGDILADGTKYASERIGKGSEKFAMNVRGQDLAMHSPKYYKSLGMTYAFDPTPGRHTAACLDMMVGGPMVKPNGLFEGFGLPRKYKRSGEDRYEAMKLVAGLWQATSSLGLCQFTYFFQKYPLIEIVKAVTGWDTNMDEIVENGLRIQTLRQSFTLREGVSVIDNKLPERAVGVDYLEDYKGYCEKIGWNPENGYPLKETLQNLDLDFVVEDLY